MSIAIDVTMFDDEPVNQRKSDWLTVGLLLAPAALRYVQPDVNVCLQLHVGATTELWVGRVMAVSDERFAFAPWGQPDARTLRLSDVLRAGVVPPHSWAERHEVVQRQRRGLPAR